MSHDPAPPSPQPYRPAPRPQPAPSGGSGWLLALLAFLLFCSLAFNFLMIVGSAVSSSGGSDRVTEKTVDLDPKVYPAKATGAKKIAVLKLEGVIMDGEGYLRKQIDTIRDDEDVKAVVLRVNSPGGTVTGSDQVFHRLKTVLEKRKLPMVVSMGSLCASGGYFIAMAVGQQDTKENVIYAEPTTWSGSIGVIIPHYDFSGLAEWAKVQDDSVKSHELKGMGNPLRPMTPEERKIFEELVAESFTMFKDRVRFGRPKMTDETLTEVATGQIFTTKQALKYGLVDQEGFVEAAIDRAIELAGLKKDETRVVYYQESPNFLDLLTGANGKASSMPLDLKALLELNSPKAYFLFTRLPGLVEAR